MLSGIGNFFRGSKSQSKQTKSDPNYSLISMFSQNLDAFLKIHNGDPEKKIRFFDLISNFQVVFCNTNSEPFYENAEVQQIFDNFLSICATHGTFIFDGEKEKINNYFNSINFLASLYDNIIPNADIFYEFFCALLNKIQTSPNFFNYCHAFLLLLFQSQNFYFQFLLNDGLCIVFSTFFLKTENQYFQIQNSFIDLVFNSFPNQIFSTVPFSRVTSFTVFLDMMKPIIDNNQSNNSYKNACLYISYYLTSFLDSCPTLIDNFNSMNGFITLNKVLLNDSDHSAPIECYKLLLDKTKFDKIILLDLIELYRNEKINSNMRADIISMIFLNNQENDTFSADEQLKMTEISKKVLEITPLSTYLKRPPFLNKKGLTYFSFVFHFLLKKQIINIEYILNLIFYVISFPIDSEIPIDDYINLIIWQYSLGNLPINSILQKDLHYLPDFVLNPKNEEIIDFYFNNKSAIKLLTIVFNSNEAKNYRFHILQKFIDTSNEIENEDIKTYFSDFLLSLYSQYLSVKNCGYLLSHLEKTHIMKILINLFNKRIEYYDIFVKSNGFEYLNKYIKNNSNPENLLNLLSSLSYFHQHDEIDKWILHLDRNSPIFQIEKEKLDKIAKGQNSSILHIPSLLPFCNDFDLKFGYNRYLAGKYGLPSYLKFEIKPAQIPHFQLIANQYMNQHFIDLLFNEKYYAMLDKLVDISLPSFSFYELIPKSFCVQSSENDASFLNFEQNFLALSFWYRIPITFSQPFLLASIAPGILEIFAYRESLVLQTHAEKISFQISHAKWHNIVLNINLKRNVVNACHVYIDLTASFELKFEEQTHLPSFVIFGDTKKVIPVSLQIAKNVILNDNPFTAEDIEMIYQKGPADLKQATGYTSKSEFAFDVHYLGFASFFKTEVELEELFDCLDNIDVIYDFQHVSKALMNIAYLNKIDFDYYWNRMIISIKRQKELIGNHLDTVHNLIKSIVDLKVRMKAIEMLLADTEIYCIFDARSIEKPLISILTDSSIDWNYLEKLKLADSLFSTIRSGINENIQMLLIPILNKLFKANQSTSKFKAYMNAIVSINLQNDSFDMFNSTIQFDELIRSSKCENKSKVLIELLYSFVESAKIFCEEIFPLKQLLLLMILFNSDEKVLILMDLLCFYSYKNPKYIKKGPQQLLHYIFGQLSDNPKVWKYAISILAGDFGNNTYELIHIKRVSFIPIIVDMLSALAAKCAYSIFNQKDEKLIELFSNVILELLKIEPIQFYLFYQYKNSSTYLSLLSFLGIIPNSFISNNSKSNSSRENQLKLAFTLNPISKGDIKEIISYTTSSNLFPPIKIPSKFYEDSHSSVQDLLIFESEIDNENELIEFVIQTHLIDFFIKILFSEADNIEPNDFSTFQSLTSNKTFEKTLFDLLSGNSMMYLKYWQKLCNLLIMHSLNMICTKSITNPLNYMKIVFEAIDKYIFTGIFNDNYLDLMKLVFLIFKKGFFTIEHFLNDEKYLKMYRDFLLMVFNSNQTQKNEEDNILIFDCLMQNKVFVFNKLIFNDSKFASLWLHAFRTHHSKANDIDITEVNRESKMTDPYIACMSFFLNIVDDSIVASYDPQNESVNWTSFINQDLLDTSDNENKTSSIIETKQEIFIEFAKAELLSRVYHAANFSIEQNLAFYQINIRQRHLERMMFKQNQNRRKRNCNDVKSYFLSSLSYPIVQPRAMSPSPYSIKSPPCEVKNDGKHVSNDEIYYHLDYKPLQQRIPAIEKCGILNCSPEWYQFHDSNGNVQFNSVFEYSQIIEQGPPSALSLFEDAFEEYFHTSNENVPLSPIASLKLSANPKNYERYDVSFLYYIHNIPSVLFLTEQYLLLVILAKGSLQLISKPENPMILLPFTESVALGEYNNRVSMFCGHVVLIIKYDDIIKMKNHLYIHKNLGLSISSYRSSDIILIFNTSNEMVHANNHIVAKRMKQQQRKEQEIRYKQSERIPIQPQSSVKSTLSIASVSSQMSFGFGFIHSQATILPLNSLNLYPPCSSLLLFTIDSLSSASLLWKNNIIDNFHYLLLLNSFGDRSFTDLSQYPIVPWIANPEPIQNEESELNSSLNDQIQNDEPRSNKEEHQNDNLNPIHDQLDSNIESISNESDSNDNQNDNSEEGNEIIFQMRNLALPMGQLSKSRAAHFDQTYELSEPAKYFYGFHYSLPGAVFWFLMRLPPFNFFLWDLNNGWDNSQRLFISISDAYTSSASSNQSDLKELVPAIYQVPELYFNISNMKLNTINDTVILPNWSHNNPYYFTEFYLKLLNQSMDIQKWIDLIFGYKQTGNEAVEFKNLFLPTSYHNSTAEDLKMDQESFNSQVLNFGQCPIQLFTRSHPFKLLRRISASKEKLSLTTFHPKTPTRIVGIKFNVIDERKTRNSSLQSSAKLRFITSAPLKDTNSSIRNSKPQISTTDNESTDISPMPNTDQSDNSIIKKDDSNKQAENLTEELENTPNLSTSSKELDTNEESIIQNSTKIGDNSQKLNCIQVKSNRNEKSLIWETKDLLACRELINPLSLITFNPVPIGNLYIALPIDSILYPLKCSGSTLFFIVDKKMESISLIRMSTSIETIFVLYSSEFAFLNDLSVSDDGMFISISFSFGKVDVYRVIYDEFHLTNNKNSKNILLTHINAVLANKNEYKLRSSSMGCPTSLVKFASYTHRVYKSKSISCIKSILLSQDFLCASLFDDDSIVIWNFANEMRHRVIYPKIDFSNEALEFKVVSLHFDSFDAVLSVVLKHGVIQYSLNAKRLRSYIINNNSYITCSNILGLDFTFDNRLLILGLSDGSIQILTVSSSRYEFNKPFVVKMSTNPIVSILSQQQLMRAVCVDSVGSSRLFDFRDSLDENSVVVRCSDCENPQTTMCRLCQMPLCDGCVINHKGICRDCFEK